MALPASRLEDIARDLAETVDVDPAAPERHVLSRLAASPMALGAAGRLGLAVAALAFVWTALAWSIA